MTLTHLSLFSGIGGLDLAAHWAGFQTVAFCEQNKFCQEVLGKHWPGVPIYDDIFTLTATALAGRGIEPGTITLISGGFPCQPYSFAGKRVGNADDRALWPQMLRVIREVRPLYVLGENVPGLISLALDGVLSDLEGEGYTCQTVVLPACAVNAPHRRDRVFIIAHADSRISKSLREDKNKTWATKTFRSGNKTMAHTEGWEDFGRERGNMAGSSRAGQGSDTAANTGREDVAHTQHERWESGSDLRPERNNHNDGRLASPGSNGNIGWLRLDTGKGGTTLSYTTGAGLPDWAGFEMGQPQPVTEFERPDGREVERNFRGVATRVSRRVDRLRALGNAVNPMQAYPILKAIADYELQGQIA